MLLRMTKSLVEEAFKELYPDKTLSYETELNYHDRFNPYNANIKMRGNFLQFNLSKRWKEVSKDIQIGLIQDLFVRLFKDKKTTMDMELYHIFLKKVHLAVPKTKSDPILEESFNRVNEKYFYETMEKPNLVWGSDSKRKLGSYEFGSDTIMISTIFKISRPELLDYIMYHELLHKKLKFTQKNGRSMHHTNEFKQLEMKFENYHQIQNDIKQHIRKTRKSLLKELLGL